MPDHEIDKLRTSINAIKTEVGHVDVKLAVIEQQLDRQDETLAQIKQLLEGEGDRPGMKTRFDRTERTLANYAKVLWLIAGTVVAMLIKAIAGAMK